jgi:hypothetical protein
VTEPSPCRHNRSWIPSSRYSDCDGTNRPVTCENSPCDRCDGIAGCRHNHPETGAGQPVPTHPDGTVTRTIEISGITFCLPTTLPVLTPRTARALLAILVELTEVPVLEEVRDDC